MMDRREKIRPELPAEIPLEQAVDLLGAGFIDTHRRQLEGNQVLGIILRLVEAVSDRLSCEEICKCVIEILMDETGFENASILLYDSDVDLLRLVAAKGFLQKMRGAPDRKYNTDLVFKRGEGVAWQVFESHNPVFIEDAETEPLPEKIGTCIKPRSLACLPLWNWGVLNLSADGPVSMPNYRRRDLIILSNVIGHLLYTTDLNEKLDRSHTQLKQLIDRKTNELRHANRELRANVAYMESVIENAPQGICLIGPEGTIQHVNPKFTSILACEQGKITGTSPDRLFRNKSEYLKLKQAIDNGKMIKLSDVAMLRPDGSIFPADIFMHPLRHSGDSRHGSMLVIHDITHQKKATEKLVYTEKLRALGSMAGGIAHDFNNLLTTILGNVELLSMKTDNEAILNRLKNIEKAVNDGAYSVRKLQTFTGFGKKREEKNVSVDISRLIRDAVEFTSPKWKDDCQKNGINIEVQMDLQATSPVSMHPSEIREILINLIFNAVEAMPEGGTLTFRSRENNSKVIMEVQDTGVGMAGETCKRIFDPYFTTKGVGNSGLGLSVTYGIVVKAGGMIRVNSEEGKGTVMTLTLPVAQKRIPDEVDITGTPETKSLKILVIDDEDQIVDLLSAMLEGLGHKVVGVHDGRKALSCMEKDRFDLVLTDLGMPGVSGWEVTKKVKEISPETPVVLLTGWGAEYEGRDLTDSGVAAVLGKPFRLEELMKMIADYCR